MEELRRHDAQTTMDSPPLTAIQAIDMALAIIESIPLTAFDGADRKQKKKDLKEQGTASTPIGEAHKRE